MPMTLRLPNELDAELRSVAAADHRSVHQAAVYAIETYLALRETAELRADPQALRSLALAQESIDSGDLLHGPTALHELLASRLTT